MYFEKLTVEEINSLPKNLPILIPVAAIEQHSAHLPVSTDRSINQALCEGLEGKNTGAQLILPIVAVSCSGHHLSLGGTLSVSHRTLMLYLEDIIDSLTKQGFYNLIILNSHGGNIAISKCICESVALKHTHINIMGITWWNLIIETLVQICENQTIRSGHACEMETSIMMYAFPESVRAHKIKDGDHVPMPEWAAGDMIQPPPVTLVRTMGEMTLNGIQGSPSKATPEKGKRIIEAFSEKMTLILQDFKELPPRKSD